ncbi:MULTISPECIES: hypothetical protein [Bacillus cereus group]
MNWDNESQSEGLPPPANIAPNITQIGGTKHIVNSLTLSISSRFFSLFSLFLEAYVHAVTVQITNSPILIEIELVNENANDITINKKGMETKNRFRKLYALRTI